MEIVSLLRVLARHRLLVVAGLVLALAIGTLTWRRSTQERTAASAWSNVLVTMPSATASDLASDIADTLPDRAALLADVMASDTNRAAIASDSGLRLSDLAVRVPAMNVIQLPVPLPVAAQQAGTPVADYVATLATQDPTSGNGVPIIGVAVSGPRLDVAKRIVAATTRRMRQVVDIYPDGRETVLAQPLGRPQGQTTVVKGRMVLAIVAPLGVALAWCSAIVVISGLSRRSRVRRQRAAMSMLDVRSPAT